MNDLFDKTRKLENYIKFSKTESNSQNPQILYGKSLIKQDGWN